MNKLVIAVSREFGSGGRLIGEKLAAELGILFYDKAIIELAAQRSGLSPDFIEQLEERASNSFLFNLVSATYSSPSLIAQYDVPISHKAFFAQSSVIQELAERDSCVIVGRCADYILRDNPSCVKIFIYADKEDRIRRVKEKYNYAGDDVKEKVTKIDKGRANFYKHYTCETWGSVHNHDLSINSSLTGVDGAVETIKAMLRSSKLV